ncbi:MAG TPA: Rad52/Rad22 family DNA repair protein [Gemmatimonadaceae bacterium]|nr:Rad52/Rad22 family DNA repair protein [Gemmatimonadaceae bacterium]
MISRHDTPLDRNDLWARLAAPLPAGAISWRQDGRPVQRDGRWIARFVCYVDANTVRERLDTVVPGEWDLTLDLLPALPGDDGEQNCSFKARLQILGVIREDVGTGRDYKSAATDAFKRAAVRFGVAHELYAFEQNWVQVDGDGRYAKPLEDPAAAYARRYGTLTGPAADASRVQPPAATDSAATVESATGPRALDEPSCPRCGGRMWDNRATRRNPKAPDYKCRTRSCDGAIWPPRGSAAPDGVQDEGALLESGT